jgi:DNA replication protein DnaC
MGKESFINMNREERWDHIKNKIIKNMFPPRIARDLHKYNFNCTKYYNYMSKNNKNLYIFGDPGTGKTLYACCLLLESVKQNFLQRDDFNNHLFISVPDLFEDIRKTYSQTHSDSHTKVEICKDIGWLVLDDLGAEKASEWTLQQLYLIINHRYEYLKPTIITSNYSLDELDVKFGNERITSRIAAMSIPKNMTGLDLRIQNND